MEYRENFLARYSYGCPRKRWILIFSRVSGASVLRSFHNPTRERASEEARDRMRSSVIHRTASPGAGSSCITILPRNPIKYLRPGKLPGRASFLTVHPALAHRHRETFVKKQNWYCYTWVYPSSSAEHAAAAKSGFFFLRPRKVAQPYRI